jgi:SAM-dependent methyltransferase
MTWRLPGGFSASDKAGKHAWLRRGNLKECQGLQTRGEDQLEFICSMPYSNKLRYLLWAGARFLNADTSCPACSEVQTVLVRRKYGVTALYRCTSCEVMFRVPKASQEEDVQFYQRDYEQGFSTDCPTPDELTRLKRCCFADTEKDYSSYVEVLRATRLDPGSVIYDFGCSWGYGSWQLRHAGYRVYSFEVSRPRARYAVENLQCELCTPDELPEKADCFFAAHVIEHLTNPRVLWEMALDVNKPAGKVVFFLPNGEPSRELLHRGYHQLWGQVHPLLLSPLALVRMGELYGFNVRCYSSPYNMQEIAKEAPGELAGDELLVLASRQPSAAP